MAIATRANRGSTFKHREGVKFTLMIDERQVHDIIRQETKLGGRIKMSGFTKPQNIVDTYRAVLYFMWGIPLDTPIDPEVMKSFTRALERLKQEDPELFAKPRKRRSPRA